MRRLLWKEWQERRLWLLLWLLSVLIISALANGIVKFGQYSAADGWGEFVPVIFALLAGLGAFGSELTRERATFLYSRALGWPQVLLAKVVPGVGMAVAAPLLGALVLYLVVPPPYRVFLTVHHLLDATGIMILATGCAFLIGLACSMVLPGLAGATFALLLLAGIFFVAMFVQQEVLSNIIPMYLPFSLLGGPLLAAVLARRRLTLSPGARVWRFLAVVLPVVTAGFFLDWLPAVQGPVRQPNRRSYYDLTISPSGRNAFVTYARTDQARPYWLRVQEQRLTPLTNYQFFQAWASNDILLTGPSANEVTRPNILYWWEAGRLRSAAVSLPNNGYYDFVHLFVSPDGRRVLVPSRYSIQVVDLRTGTARTLTSLPPIQQIPRNTGVPDTNAPFTRTWWASNTVVGYLDPLSGKRVMVPVGE